MDEPPTLSAPIGPPPRDRLGLADVMILVAAFAFGLGWLRMEIRSGIDQETGWTFYTPTSSTRSNLAVVSWLFEATVPIVGSLTLALSLIQLRRPGLLSGASFGRPGLLSCISASVAIMLYLLRSLGSALVHSWHDPALPLPFYDLLGPSVVSGRLLVDLAYPAGVAVLATWLITRLGLSTGVRSGAGDLAGRIVGHYWVTMIAVRILFETIWAMA